jgi:hypothetical protein
MTPKKAAPKPKKAENPDRIAVLKTHTGFPLVLRSDPDPGQVREFVREHNRRYHAGLPGGPDGNAALLIQGGFYFEEESGTGEYDFGQGAAIDLGGVL